MDWQAVLSSDAEEAEKNEELLERLYQFFLQTDLPQQESPESELLEDKSNLLKLVSLLRSVARVKGLEAQAAEEELSELQEKHDSTSANVGRSERDLLDQVVQLEKEVRQREFAIGQLKRQADAPSPSVASEVRYLRDQVDSLERRAEALQRSLDHERQENERASGELAEERQRGRERDREVERLHQNLEDYRRQLENTAGDQRLEATNYRDLIGQREDEIRRQIDKIEELVEERDTLEKQLSQLTALLGQVEERRLTAIKDMENMKVALSEADSRTHELEDKNTVLEGQVVDLQERLQLQSGADEQIMTMVTSKASQWESTLAAKQVELDDCKKRMVFLEEQLRVAQRQTDRATLVKLKKQVQEKDETLTSLKEELSEAVERVDLLTSQLDEARRKSDPANINAELKQEVDQLQGQVEGLNSELRAETHRREEAELHVEEKDAELAGALARLGEYERGEYGLYEAVQEIKMKKDELAVRDKDIAELTQQVNHLDNQLNQMCEENEALREHCGVGGDEAVDVGPLRARRETELDQLRQQNRVLEQQLARLEDEKLDLRKQLIDRALSHKTDKTSPVYRGAGRLNDRGRERGGAGGDDSGEEVESSVVMVVELRRRVKELELHCEAEQRQRKIAQQEGIDLSEQLRQAHDKVRQYEAALKELTDLLKSTNAKLETRKKTKKEDVADDKLQAVERLISMLEAQGAQSAGGGQYDVTLHLKSEVSQLSGQNSELRSRLHQCEAELKTAVRLAERRDCEVEGYKKDIHELQKVRAGFQALVLPEGLPPTSSDVITRLNEHLLNVLSQLHRKEVELGQAQEALEKFQRKFSVIIHQQGILYQEYSVARRDWEGERDKLIASKNQLTTAREQDQVRVRELANLQETLASGEDVQRRRIAEVSRKVTLLQVNEKTLSRRYTLLLDSEAALRKENDRLRQDMVTMERAITERMGYLQRHKEASSFKLSSLQHQLSESVPKSTLEKANQEYSELVIKYQQCLQKQTAYAADTSAMERLQVEVKTLSDHLENTKQDLTSEKQKNHLLEQQLRQNTGGVARRAHSSHGSSASFATNGGVSAGVSEALAEKVATLEMKEMNERQRADLASVRCKQLQEATHQLEYRNSSLELKFSELTQKLLQSQAREVDLRDQLTSSLPLEEKASLEGHIEALKKREAELKLQNSQLQEVAEVSKQQVVAIETKKKSHDLELSSLRHQLLDVQMQSDERSVIGKLHHQIVALQVSESNAVHSAEEKSAKIMRLEASLLRSEQEKDGLTEALFHARADAHKKTGHLRTTVQALRRQLVGALPLSEQERHTQLLQQLREDKREAEAIKEQARRDQERVQDKLAELELQHSNLQELLGVLREQTKGSSSAGGAGKLMEWHAKLGEVRMKEMKVTRTNERLQQRIKHLEELLASSERDFTKLEQNLVQVTKDHESCQLSWEQREAELEQQVERFQREHDSIIMAAKKMETASGDMPDTKLPVAGQLEQALKRLRENGQTMSELREREKESKGEADRMEKALNRAQGELLRREKELSELRMNIARLQQNASEDIASEKAELQRALRSAQASIDDLKSQVSQKEQLAEKYQRLLQEARNELHATTDAHKTEVASLTAKLHSQADSALSRLKEAALEAVNPPQPPHLTDTQLNRLRELEELTEEQEKAITQLRRQGQQVKHEMEQDKQVSKNRLTRLQQELSDTKTQHEKEVSELHSAVEEKSCRVVELEQELEVMMGELSAAQQAAKQAPSRTMKTLVERLRNQLAMKEKQHRALSQALLQVRADLVDTAQRTLEGEAAREAQETNVKELVEKRTQQLQSQLADVRCQLDEVKGHLGESQARETSTLKDMAKMEGELSEKTSLVERLESELKQLRKRSDEARTREQKLAHELQELHLKLESNSETELQKRVKILQGKLDKQKQLTKEYEAALKSHKQSQVGGASGVGGANGTGQPLVDSKHHSVEVLKWEESKKWQRKVEMIRAKLSEKNKELEGVRKQVSSLKEMLSRADREKSLLQGKLRLLQRNIIESTGRPQLGSGQGKEATPTSSVAEGAELSDSEKYQLKSRVYQLESKVQKLQHQLKLDKDVEQFELRSRCNQLSSTVKVLEAQLQQVSMATKEAGDLTGGGASSVSPLGELLTHSRELEEQLLKCQKENVTLRFEYEQATVELPRLQAQVKDQQQYIELLSAHQDGNVRTASTAPPKKEGSHHSVTELERVVGAMRKVVERLQTENGSLKKSLAVAKSRKNGHTDRTVLEEENSRLKSELERLQAGVLLEEGGDQKQPLLSSKSPYVKIVTENERLRKDLKKEVERNEKMQLSLTTLELRNNKLQQDLAEQSRDQSQDPKLKSHDKSRDYEERIERLQVELEKKTSMLMEVRRHLHEAVERERQLKSLSADPKLSENYLTVVRENEHLQHQVAEMKKELDAFDPNFFEELEDLKYNYQEAVKKNIQYEEQLNSLAKEYGFQLDT